MAAPMTGYAHPEALVETGWVAEHMATTGVRLVEVDVDTTPTSRATFPARSAGTGRPQLCDTDPPRHHPARPASRS